MNVPSIVTAPGTLKSRAAASTIPPPPMRLAIQSRTLDTRLTTEVLSTLSSTAAGLPAAVVPEVIADGIEVQNIRWKSGSPVEGGSRAQDPPQTGSIGPFEVHDNTLFEAPSSDANLNKRQVCPDLPKSQQLSGQPLLKKARIASNSQSTIGPLKIPKGSLPKTSLETTAPLSPLFFSHTPRPRPPRMTSFEKGGSMLNGSHLEESGGIRTVRLARGLVNMSSSPPRASSTPNGRFASDKPNPARALNLDLKEASRGLQDLNQVGVVELLEQDDRPTFIVDLGNQSNYQPGPLQIIYANGSLRSYGGLFEALCGSISEDPHSLVAPFSFHEFKSWTLSFVKNNESLDPDYFGNFRGAQLSSNNATPCLENEMLSMIESSDPGRDPPPQDTAPGKLHPVFQFGSDQTSASGTRPNEPILSTAAAGETNSLSSLMQEQGFFDWTRLPNTPALPRHVQFARSVDWASTDLGPIENWPLPLRGMCNLIMASPHPAAMYWGASYIAIYNEAYIHLAGLKHPSLMGQGYATAWPELWDDLEEVFELARLTGQATMKDDDCIFINRNGFLEETYFSWSIIPLVGEDGSVVGLYNPCFEKTRRKIAERRMLTLREVGERTAAAREVGEFWGEVLTGLDCNEYDTPFVLLYSVIDENDSDGSSMHSNSTLGTKQCVLEGTLPKLPEGHLAAPQQLDLKSGIEGFGPQFREVMITGKPVLLQTENGSLDEKLIRDMDWRGFGEMPRAAIVCLIHATTGDSIMGFLVMGINPRRPYDDDYNLFIQLLSRQLATSMASVVLFEEEIRRGQRAAKLAALDRIELSEKLAVTTQQAVDSETKFTRMAEFAPVGMFIADSEGRTIFTNDSFHEISMHPKIRTTDNWTDAVKDEDKPMVMDMWQKLVEERIPMSAEFRFKGSWKDRDGVDNDTWVLASAYPEKYPDGSLKSVFGSITNISQQKWAEDLQKKRMEEAVELKRQQEAFIDITSHEMRNPLSAIIQCADEISQTLTNYKASDGKDNIPMDLIDSNIEAAQTIALCANHQTRIVSDVLTLSKLDSALLLVTPVDARPKLVAQQALKMFEGELCTADIKMRFKVDESIERLKVDWVRVDPSRLLQILINLTSNAIKFTSTQKKRVITLTLAATLERPSTDADSLFSYVPTRSSRKCVTEGLDWGNGEVIYLNFSVQDTGKGLTEDETKILFLRFSQANPKTHVQYGGSGLGLFISRELVELQGGEIGVFSESGKGSTFAFYVKARRSSAPPEPKEEQVPSSPQISSSNLAPKLFFTKPQGMALNIRSTAGVLPDVSHQRAKDIALKVLIVEDNLVNQRVLSKQLRNLGCTVYIANHGGECIDRLKDSWWWTGHKANSLELSVILMDLEMPIMDGLTCAKKIRQLQEAGEIVGHVPIIAVTANARNEQIATAIDAGMDDVVSKPFRIPELIPKIEVLLLRYKSPHPST